MLAGYAWVSSTGQPPDVQTEQLRAAGCEKLFAEKRTGTTTDGRQALADTLDFVREEDVLVVTRLDRPARSVPDLHGLIARPNAKGVGFRCLQQAAVDTTTPTGKLMLAILAGVAEFEADLRRERQRDGIDKAKAAGVYKGRPASSEGGKVRQLHAEGIRPAEIAKRLGIGRASVYRHLKAA